MSFLQAILQEIANKREHRAMEMPAVAPPVPVEYPMSTTMEVEYDRDGRVVATPPTDFDG